MYGPCFVPFRYSRYNLGNISSTIETAKGAGYQNGLTLTLRNNYDDYFFTTLATTGYIIHIFYPKDFPDKLSGSLSENIVSFGTETMINLDVKVMKPTENLQSAPQSMVRFVVYLLKYCRNEECDKLVHFIVEIIFSVLFVFYNEIVPVET